MEVLTVHGTYHVNIESLLVGELHGDTEVSELYQAVFRGQDIGSLDIPMQHSLVVQVL